MRDSHGARPTITGFLPALRQLVGVAVFLISAALPSHASEPYTITGSAFDAFVNTQDTSFQRLLVGILPESLDYQITGPIDAASPCPEEMRWLFRSVRVICPDLESVKPALERLRESKILHVKKTKEYIDKALGSAPSGFRGVMVRVQLNKTEKTFVVQSVQQTRWLVWARKALLKRADYEQRPGLKHYSLALSNYFHRLDTHHNDFPAPRAVDFEVSDDSDPFSPAPLEILEGDESYEALIDSSRTLHVDYAHEIFGFIPSPDLVEELIALAPHTGFYNKTEAIFQRQIQTFGEKGGTWRSMKTLSKLTADTISPGEYFFAVGMSGKIRFGREPDLEQAVANEAFLFPGEPVLTAGKFTVCGGGPGRISKVSTRSSVFFFSNLAPTIHDDIVTRSDHYLSTLGHFLETIVRLGLPTRDLVISKF